MSKENIKLIIRSYSPEEATEILWDELSGLLDRCEEAETHRDFLREEREWIRDGEPIAGKRRVHAAWDKYWQRKQANEIGRAHV